MKNLLYLLLGTIFILFLSCNDDIHKVSLQDESISADKQYIHYLPDNRPAGIYNFQVKELFSEDYDGSPLLGEVNGKLQCSSKVVSYDKKDNKFFLMDNDVGVLWPGNIVSEKSIKGTPTSIPLYGETRNPIEIQVDGLRPTDSPPYAKIEEPTPGKVGQALSKILKDVAAQKLNIAGKLNITVQNVYSQEQVRVAFNLGYSGEFANFSSKFGVDFNKEKTRCAVSLTQEFYTVSVTPKANLMGKFGWFVHSDDIASIINGYGITDFQKNPKDPNAALFIKSVSYGRRILVLYESEASTSDLEAALNFSYNEVVTSVSAELKAKYKKILSNAKVTLRQLGGNSEDGVEAMLSSLAKKGNIAEVLKEIKKHANWGPNNAGYPLSYTLHTTSGNTKYSTKTSLKYNQRDCSIVDVSNIRVAPISVHFSEYWGGHDRGHGAELFGFIRVDKYDAENRKWWRVGQPIFWGYGVDIFKEDYYPLSRKVHTPIDNGKVIDFKIKNIHNARFRVVSGIGECDYTEICKPYKTRNLRVYPTGSIKTVIYEYNPSTKLWTDVFHRDKSVKDPTVKPDGAGERTWNGIQSTVQGDGVYLDFYIYITE